MYACMHLHIFLCVCVYSCIYIYIYIYIGACGEALPVLYWDHVKATKQLHLDLKSEVALVFNKRLPDVILNAHER